MCTIRENNIELDYVKGINVVRISDVEEDNSVGAEAEQITRKKGK